MCNVGMPLGRSVARAIGPSLQLLSEWGVALPPDMLSFRSHRKPEKVR